MSSDESSDTPEELKRLHQELKLWEPKQGRQYDRIEASLSHPYLQPATKWGFVIVRTVYDPSSDVLWAQLLKLLRTNISDELWIGKQDELFPFHQITTIENEAALGGADSYAVRRTFRAWVAADLPQRLRGDSLEEFGGVTQICEKLLSKDTHAMPPRWKYCLFFDDDCLRSVPKPPEEPNLKDPALKILTTDWELEEEEIPMEEFTKDWDGGATDDEYEEVGWMYMYVSDYISMYNRLNSASAWSEYYERPYRNYVDDSD